VYIPPLTHPGVQYYDISSLSNGSQLLLYTSLYASIAIAIAEDTVQTGGGEGGEGGGGGGEGEGG
jgi:hypothetical protein